MESERRLLMQLAPEMSEDTLRRLVAVFYDLRRGYEQGSLTYPYSLRGEHRIVRFTTCHLLITVFRADQPRSAYEYVPE